MSKESKQRKKVESVVNHETVTYQQSHNFFDNVDFFENIKEVKTIVTVDMSRVDIVDYMSSSRVDFFRKLVKKNANFNLIALIDYKYYQKTNDRSKSQKFNKYTCACKSACIRSKEKKEINETCFADDIRCEYLHLCNKYSRKRTRKQLADVLQETDIVNHVNNTYNVNKYQTVDEYIKLVK